MQSLKVLLLENVADQAAVARSTLVSAGYRLVISRFETDGLKKAREWKPNVIILSNTYTKGSLAEFARLLKSETGGSTRIIVASSVSPDRLHDREPALKEAVDSVVQRPYHPRKLLTSLEGAQGMEAAEKPPPEPLPPEPPLELELQGKKILLVDRDPMVARILNETLKPKGVQVAVVPWQQAREHCRRDPPQVIMLEWPLPDGFSLSDIREIRRGPEGAPIPLLVLASASKVDVKSSSPDLAEMANSIIPKPVAWRSFFPFLINLLQRTPGTAPPPPSPVSAPAGDDAGRFQQELEAKFLEVEELKSRLMAAERQLRERPSATAALDTDKEKLRYEIEEGRKASEVEIGKFRLREAELEVKLNNIIREKSDSERRAQDLIDTKTAAADKFETMLEEAQGELQMISEEKAALSSDLEKVIVEKEQAEEKLQAALNAMEKERKGLQQEAGEAQASLEEKLQLLQAEEKKGGDRFAKLEEQVEGLEEELEEKKKESAALEESLREKEEAVAELEAELSSNEENMSRLREEIGGLREQLSESETSLADLSAQEAKVSEERDGIMEELEKLRAAEKGRPESEAVSREGSEELANQQKIISSLEDKVVVKEMLATELEARVVELQAELSALRSSTDEGREDSAELRENLRRVDEELQERDEKIEVLEAQLRERDEESGDFEKQLRERDEERKNLEGKLKEREEEGSALEKQLQERGEMMEALEAQLQGVEEKNELLEKQLKEKDEKIRSLEDEAQGRAEGTTRSESELRERDERILDLVEQLRQRDDKTAELEARVLSRSDELDVQLKRVTEEKEELRRTLEEERRHLAASREEILSLEDRQRDLRNELEREHLSIKERDEESSRVLREERERRIDLEEQLAAAVRRAAAAESGGGEFEKVQKLLQEVTSRAQQEVIERTRKEVELQERLKTSVEEKKFLLARMEKELAQATEREKRLTGLLNNALKGSSERGDAERDNLPMAIAYAPEKRPWTAIATAGLAAAVLIAAGGWFALRGRTPTPPGEEPVRQSAAAPVEAPSREDPVASQREVWELWTRSDVSGGVLLQATLRSREEIAAEVAAEQKSQGWSNAKTEEEMERLLEPYSFAENFYFYLYLKNLEAGYPSYVDDIYARLLLRDDKGNESKAFLPSDLEKYRRVYSFTAGELSKSREELIYEVTLPVAFSRRPLTAKPAYIELLAYNIGASSRRVLTWELE